MHFVDLLRVRRGRRVGLERPLWCGVAWALLFMVGLKGWMDLDPTWDTWYYHLPFAGRLWGMTPESSYVMESRVEKFYLGLPLLGEWLQGLLWRVSGHVQASNGVGFLSLFAYMVFLRRHYGVRIGMAAVALLAIPVVQAHASSSYVDLPANLAASALILLTWDLLRGTGDVSRRQVKQVLLCAFLAAQVKVMMMPVAGLCLLVAGGVAWRRAGQMRSGRRVAAYALVMAVVFWVPIKNTILYENPFYPVRWSVGPVTFSGIDFSRLYPVPTYLKQASRPMRWLMSVTEVNQDFGQWSVDSMVLPWGAPGIHMGGFCGWYVLLSLMALAALCRGLPLREARATFGVVAVMTMVAACLPQSHELRYYQFWMIVVVSMNLALWQRGQGARSVRIAMPVSSAVMLVIALVATKFFYIVPQGIGMVQLPVQAKRMVPFTFMPDEIDTDLLLRLQDGDIDCLRFQQPFTYLYADYFHPPARYSLRAADLNAPCPKP